MRGTWTISRSIAVLAILSFSCVFQTGCSVLFPSTGPTPSKLPAPTFSISGKIGPSANGIGAKVYLSGPETATTTTDSKGNYLFEGLTAGTYTVTPAKSQYKFNPPSLSTTVNAAAVAGLNFIAEDDGPTYSLSGRIAGGPGATVTLSGEAHGTTVADAAGNYSFEGLEKGNYTVTPSKNLFTFSPASRNETVNANVSAVNFTAQFSGGTTYSISGVISPKAYGSGVTVSLSGAASAMTTTDSSGQYSFSNLSNGTYTIVPSKTDFTFSPAGQSAIVTSANVAGVNFTATQIVTGGGATIYPGQDIPSIVSASPAGTTFVITPGKYRLTRAILPKDGDSFMGQTVCAPPATACPAIISGSVEIGPQAVFDGTNYRVVNQTQHGPGGGHGGLRSGLGSVHLSRGSVLRRRALSASAGEDQAGHRPETMVVRLCEPRHLFP